MLTTLNDIITYLKAPNCPPIEQLPAKDKVLTVFYTLILSLLIGFTLAIVIGLTTLITELDIGKHASSDLFKNYTPVMIIFLAAIAAPIIEELIFRAPIRLFCKFKGAFKYIFYGFALLFGYIHILNYETTFNVLILSPILVAPQICLGLILGYLRVKLGLIYSILLHMLYNASIVIPSILFLKL